MLLNRAIFRKVVIGALVAFFLWGAYEFSPGRQIDHAFNHFLEAVSDRNWKKVDRLMAADYHDQWGSNKEQAIHWASEGLQHFLALQITATDVNIVREGRQATITARLKIVGKGNAIGEAIMQQVNDLKGEFRFVWKRQSWKPWDWKLESFSQPEISFDPNALP